MATTLTKGVDVLALPDELQWVDEFDHNVVAAEVARSMDGALIVDEAVRLAGRSITLEGTRQYGWMPRGDLLTLQAWKALPGQAFVLLYRGVSYNVVMDHNRGALAAQQITDYPDPDDTDYYAVTLRFLTV